MDKKVISKINKILKEEFDVVPWNNREYTLAALSETIYGIADDAAERIENELDVDIQTLLTKFCDAQCELASLFGDYIGALPTFEVCFHEHFDEKWMYIKFDDLRSDKVDGGVFAVSGMIYPDVQGAGFWSAPSMADFKRDIALGIRSLVGRFECVSIGDSHFLGDFTIARLPVKEFNCETWETQAVASYNDFCNSPVVIRCELGTITVENLKRSASLAQRAVTECAMAGDAFRINDMDEYCLKSVSNILNVICEHGVNHHVVTVVINVEREIYVHIGLGQGRKSDNFLGGCELMIFAGCINGPMYFAEESWKTSMGDTSEYGIDRSFRLFNFNVPHEYAKLANELADELTGAFVCGKAQNIICPDGGVIVNGKLKTGNAAQLIVPAGFCDVNFFNGLIKARRDVYGANLAAVVNKYLDYERDVPVPSASQQSLVDSVMLTLEEQYSDDFFPRDFAIRLRQVVSMADYVMFLLGEAGVKPHKESRYKLVHLNLDNCKYMLGSFVYESKSHGELSLDVVKKSKLAGAPLPKGHFARSLTEWVNGSMKSLYLALDMTHELALVIYTTSE